MFKNIQKTCIETFLLTLHSLPANVYCDGTQIRNMKRYVEKEIICEITMNQDHFRIDFRDKIF